MENKGKKTLLSKNFDIVALLIITLIFSFLTLFQLFDKFEYRAYDMLLHYGKEIEQEDNILIVDIDDESLNQVGSWPWTRDIIADSLLRMREMNAYSAVFDIEYLSPASVAVDENINAITENAFSAGEQKIAFNIENFVASGRLQVENLINSVDDVLFGMYDDISAGLNKDTDDYFGRTLQFFGNASMTINTYDIRITRSQEDRDYAANRFLFKNVTDTGNFILQDNEAAAKALRADRSFIPALNSIISHAAGAGFTNVVLDKDGTRRRIELLNYYDGSYIGQLAFAPLVRMLDVQSFTRSKKALLLSGALFPGKETREDIKIPLDDNGYMLINWQHKGYADSFRHVPIYYILQLDSLESSIIRQFEELKTVSLDPSEEDLATWLSYLPDVLGEYQNIKNLKNELLSKCQGFDINGLAVGGGISSEEQEAYFATRGQFFEEIEAFASSLVDSAKARDENYEKFVSLSDAIKAYKDLFESLKIEMDNSICFIGNSATASTDLGVTPFASGYANLGTHANVMNTILQKSFIRPFSPFTGIIAAFAFALVILIFMRNASPARKNAIGIIYVILPPLVFSLLMIFFKLYIPLVIPSIIVLLAYIIQMILNFIAVEKDKSTLRKGFAAYVAPEVVNQIVKNPALLSLGGANKHITALFSDVRTFSGFTECINREEGESKGAVRLVDILNGYLGVLSDAIMDQGGTIDKYVGDEIVSFFGAPVDNPSHAFNACVAGIRMKQAEDIYNAEHLNDLPIHPITHTPFLLKSRVGLNTGDMVVGNMGTEKKLNYTVMGNNVNLASRLEGTNKAYDSWIMCSESSWKEADSGEHKGLLVSRQLDCVKVINVEKPVQIYSIVGLRSELKKEEIEAAEIFNRAMEFYLKGREDGAPQKDIDDFKKAKKLFEEAYRCNPTSDPQDKSYLSPEKKMIVRCENYIVNGLPKDVNGNIIKWNGVYTMTSK